MRRILSLFALFLFAVAFCAQELVDGTQLRQMVEKEGARLKGLQEEVEKLRGERRVLAEQMEARIHEVNDRIQALHGMQESIEEEFQEARSRRNSIISETDRSRRMLNDFAERNCLEVPPEEAVAAADARIQSQRLAEPCDCRALTPEGRVIEGTVRAFGPLKFFANDEFAGPVFQLPGGVLPTLAAVTPEEAASIRRLVLERSPDPVYVPVDIFGGEGFRERSRVGQTLWEHFRQGGAVMIPIGILAWLCLVVFVERCWYYATHGETRMVRLFHNRLEGFPEEERPRRQVEVAQRLLRRSRRGLSLLAVSASAAPLLGLLGTVTGMISTFQSIMRFGTGDARLLSGGISEALITTEAGLMLAIPALIFHAWCVRRSRRLADRLERELTE